MENSPSLYTRASEAVGRGDKLVARNLLDELVFNEPGNEQAWLLLAEVVDDLNEVCDCLQHVLAINPHNAAARQKYDDLLRRFPELEELDPVKAAAAKVETARIRAAEAAEAKKKAEAEHNTQLNLGELDVTPLFDDKDNS
jgi:hypothetical protein